MLFIGTRPQPFSKEMKNIMRYVQIVNEKQVSIREHGTEDLLGAMNSIRAGIEGRENIKDDAELRCAMFALVKEAVRRTLSIDMHDVQLAAGWAMADGKLAEMATGEGKTVTALLPACWFALRGEGVHVMTVNEYLAERDFAEMGPVCRALGFTVGLNRTGAEVKAKREAYNQDITYGVFKEFGFDYLRDHLVLVRGKRVQRPLANAIVDEADSILIDEARTPLIIANKRKAAPNLFRIGAQIVASFREGHDYEVDAETKQVVFTDEAVGMLESRFQIDNLFDLEHTAIYHALLQSLRAKAVMKRDVDYLVNDGKVSLVDAFTGRILEGRSYTDGLQQAIEAKERVALTDENVIQAEITIQSYCSLYECVAGMTGTILTEQEEIRTTYGIDAIAIPTNKPVIRQEDADVVFTAKGEKLDRILQEVQACHRRGQPVLVGTATIRQSEELAERLRLTDIPFRLLNAKTECEEAGIIVEAGQRGAVTVATNMAGRGTDIKLGAGVAELGGLCVIGTERHESRRIDKQLRGRAGRQGDPGRSCFFLSMEDELVVRYGDPEADRIQCTDAGLRAYFDQLQKRAEARMFSARSFVAQLDAVIRDQRQAVYAHRNEVLDGVTIKDYIAPHVRTYIRGLVQRLCPGDLPEEWKLELLAGKLQVLQPDPARIHASKTKRQLVYYLWACWLALRRRIDAMRGIPRYRRRWRIVYLRMLDQAWMDHVDQLNRLKLGIHYQSYANEDPIQVYQADAFKLYLAMKSRLAVDIGRWFLGQATVKLLEDVQHKEKNSGMLINVQAVGNG